MKPRIPEPENLAHVSQVDADDETMAHVGRAGLGEEEWSDVVVLMQ